MAEEVPKAKCGKASRHMLPFKRLATLLQTSLVNATTTEDPIQQLDTPATMAKDSKNPVLFQAHQKKHRDVWGVKLTKTTVLEIPSAKP